MSTPTPDNWCSRSQSSAPPPRAPGRPGDGAGGGNLIPVSPSALCSMGWRPLMITGLLRNLLTRHFSDPLQVEEPDLRHLVWREDVRTGILIESVGRWRGELVEKRPAVIIKKHARQNIRIGIGDKAGADEQGQQQYQTFWAGRTPCFASTDRMRGRRSWRPRFSGSCRSSTRSSWRISTSSAGR
jgi:hypothetical protein